MNMRRSHLNMRRSNPLLALPFCVALLSLLLLAGAHQARATETDWQTYVSPAYEDYILTASLPPGWKAGNPFPGRIVFTIEGLPTAIADMTTKAQIDISLARFRWEGMAPFIGYPFATTIHMNDMPPEIIDALKSGTATSVQLDRIIPTEGCGWLGKNGCVEFKRSPIQVSGSDGIIIEYARFKVFDPGKNAEADPKSPSEFAAYFNPFAGEMGLNIRLILFVNRAFEGTNSYTYRYHNTVNELPYREILPTVMKILESVKFQPLSEFDKNVAFDVVYEDRIRIAQRFDYEATGRFNIAYPSDWEVQKIEATPPIARVGEGRLIVSFTGPDELSSTGKPEYLIVDLKGMSDPPYGPADFLATTDPIVQSLMQNLQKISAESAEIDGLRGLASMRSTYITGTMQTYINTYVGESEDGARLKIRTYTAGGQTMVANIIFVADEADFDGTLPVIEKMIDSLSVSLFEPGFFR